jgi:Ca2+-binding EF-hand superfamily protein
MKMSASLCALLLCAVFTDGLHFLRDGQPDELPEKAEKAEKAEPKKAEKGEKAEKTEPEKAEKSAPTQAHEQPGGTQPPLEGPAHKDNFQDEIVDQADPEFDMLSGGDGCVSWDDAYKVLEEQFQEGAPDLASQTEAEKKEMEEVKKTMIADLHLMMKHADKNGDDCVDKAEFEAAEEMEGPPPGFEEKKVKEIGEEALTEEQIKEDHLEFDAMDRSGDGKVSKTEAYGYASENMPQADINDEDLDEMFKAADTDGDGEITFEEFEGAGKEIEGDGKEMQDAVPMTFKVFAWRRKTGAVRAKVSKKMLAHKPPLKIMSALLNKHQ